MKIPILFLLALLSGYATDQVRTSFTSQSITVAGGSYDITVDITWVSDDFPQVSAPGKIDLLDLNGQVIGEVVASIYGGVPATSVSGPGTATVNNSVVAVWTPGEVVADGGMELVWHLTGLTPGAYTLRLWRATSWDDSYGATTIWTSTHFLNGTDVGAPAEPPPPTPDPVYFSLNVGSGGGGSVSGGGTFAAGAIATANATPDSGFQFAGWSGDAGGTDNPLVLTMDRNWSVQANFSPIALALSTSAITGGTVTPGGSYPYGSWVSVSATADATHYFTGWSGDAGGGATSVNVFMDQAKSVVAMFASKNSQVISFVGPGDQSVGATPSLLATSSAGLPVSLTVVSGPATLSGNVLTVTGSGPVTLQATQNGDGTTLPASPVSVTFNGVAAPAKLRVQTVARTLLQDARTATAANYVLSNP